MPVYDVGFVRTKAQSDDTEARTLGQDDKREAGRMSSRDRLIVQQHCGTAGNIRHARQTRRKRLAGAGGDRVSNNTVSASMFASIYEPYQCKGTPVEVAQSLD